MARLPFYIVHRTDYGDATQHKEKCQRWKRRRRRRRPQQWRWKTTEKKCAIVGENELWKMLHDIRLLRTNQRCDEVETTTRMRKKRNEFHKSWKVSSRAASRQSRERKCERQQMKERKSRRRKMVWRRNDLCWLRLFEQCSFIRCTVRLDERQQQQKTHRCQMCTSFPRSTFFKLPEKMWTQSATCVFEFFFFFSQISRKKQDVFFSILPSTFFKRRTTLRISSFIYSGSVVAAGIGRGRRRHVWKCVGVILFYLLHCWRFDKESKIENKRKQKAHGLRITACSIINLREK